MVKIELEAWHYKVWKQWSNKVYGSTLTNNNFFDNGKIHHQESFFYLKEDELRELAPSNPEFCYYVKMQKGNELYILPRIYLDKLPLNPVQTQEIRLKKSDTIIWKLIQRVESLSIPAQKKSDFKTFIDTWNPVEHDDQMTWTLMKLMAVSPGVKMGVCAEVSSGKNANLTLLRHIRKSYAPKVNKPTKAMFYRTMYFNEHINLDEITSWTQKQVSEIEDLIVDVADDSPDMDKYARDSNVMMETMDLSNKSVTFTFNPVTKQNPESFNVKFMNADKILDRYPLFLVEGKVRSVIKDLPLEAQKLKLEENFKDMCDIVSNEQYWRQHYYQHLHNYDRSNLILERRHLNNISALLDKIDLYCESQEEFDSWVNFLNNAFINYNKMINDTEPIVTKAEHRVEEETIVEEPQQKLQSKPIKHEQKVVGVVRDKVYFKKCNKDHYMIKYHGFGISSDVLSDLVVDGVREVEIEYTKVNGDKEVYNSLVEQWLKSSKIYTDGDDTQKFLSLSEMNKK